MFNPTSSGAGLNGERHRRRSPGRPYWGTSCDDTRLAHPGGCYLGTLVHHTLFSLLVATGYACIAWHRAWSYRAAVNCLRIIRDKAPPVGPGFVNEHRHALCFKLAGYRGPGNPGTVTDESTFRPSCRTGDCKLATWAVTTTFTGTACSSWRKSSSGAVRSFADRLPPCTETKFRPCHTRCLFSDRRDHWPCHYRGLVRAQLT